MNQFFSTVVEVILIFTTIGFFLSSSRLRASSFSWRALSLKAFTIRASEVRGHIYLNQSSIRREVSNERQS